jgi:hypothetical protein
MRTEHYQSDGTFTDWQSMSIGALPRCGDTESPGNLGEGDIFQPRGDLFQVPVDVGGRTAVVDFPREERELSAPVGFLAP